VPVGDEALAGIESLKGGIDEGTKVAPVYRISELSIDLHGESRSFLSEGPEETWSKAPEDLELVAFNRLVFRGLGDNARVQGEQRGGGAIGRVRRRPVPRPDVLIERRAFTDGAGGFFPVLGTMRGQQGPWGGGSGSTCRNHPLMTIAQPGTGSTADMVLLHGGSPKDGRADRPPSRATKRKMPHIASSRTGKAHQGRSVKVQQRHASGIADRRHHVSGIGANLADKAKKLGILVWNYVDQPAPAQDGA